MSLVALLWTHNSFYFSAKTPHGSKYRQQRVPFLRMLHPQILWMTSKTNCWRWALFAVHPEFRFWETERSERTPVSLSHTNTNPSPKSRVCCRLASLVASLFLTHRPLARSHAHGKEDATDCERESESTVVVVDNNASPNLYISIFLKEMSNVSRPAAPDARKREKGRVGDGWNAR